jgi:mRNA-degrading endonuclease toxin of MazEF toxin-antitoxin module
MPNAGDVIVADMPGAIKGKRRPGVVLSSTEYLAHRPDVTAGLITTNIVAPNTTSDYVLVDWRGAGLARASAFRAYLVTVEDRDCRVIGHLSDADWTAVQSCVRVALDTGQTP